MIDYSDYESNTYSDAEPDTQPPSDPMVQVLADAFKARPPFCSGVFKLHAEDLILYYGKTGNAERIDFNNPSEDKLKHLAEVCDPATFGRGDQDIYDESYRKAGKLDSKYFSIKFDPLCCGLLDAVRGDLLEGENDRPIRAELYKLNVYGPGSFFKAHKDTPRGQEMFGSLVLVFPAKYDGGALKLRHEGAEWTIDSATALADAQESCIGYTAFFSDVEHEVAPVISGYRVTVTYNLYNSASVDAIPTSEGLAVARSPPANEVVFESALRTLLQDESFMPNGGTLGFGLRHEYPCDRKDPTKTDLGQFEHRLKGSDAMLFRVCSAMGLSPAIRVVYNMTYHGQVLLDRIGDFGWEWNPEDADGGAGQWLEDSYGGKLLVAGCHDFKTEVFPVTWVTRYECNELASLPFTTYGNEHGMHWAYIYLCLIVEVPAPPRIIDN